MDPATYERWYDTPRGRWIGEREAALVVEGLAPRVGDSLLDVGCGTGYFTRALSRATRGSTVGVDIDLKRVAYARRHETGTTTYIVADACRLPFADACFDLVVSIAALCFIPETTSAVREIVRVTRRRFAIGLLNRRSLLWVQKGRGGGRDGYRGAHWHTMAEARSLFDGLPVRHLRVRSAVQVPNGGGSARAIERLWPSAIPTGAFLLLSGEVGR